MEDYKITSILYTSLWTTVEGYRTR